MNPRTCVVTREEKSPVNMIRFVLGPNEEVVPDIKRKLPGRGVWLSNGRKFLEEAMHKGQLTRAFRKPAIADSLLAEMVDQLLERDCLDYLALAKKAGDATIGFSKVDAAVRSGQTAAVVHSLEAAEDGRSKIAQAARVSEVEGLKVINVFEGEKLDSATGIPNTTHIALAIGGLGSRFLEAVRRMEQFRNN